MIADPEPQTSSFALNGKGSVFERDSGRPDFLTAAFAYLLKL
jgi:hypothetical protein